jgi:hypothetical protein
MKCNDHGKNLNPNLGLMSYFVPFESSYNYKEDAEVSL